MVSDENSLAPTTALRGWSSARALARPALASSMVLSAGIASFFLPLFFGGEGIIVNSAWGCVLWVAQWRAARALDSQLEGLVGPV